MWSQLKILSHKDIVKGILDNKLLYPVHVQLEVTESCNYKCIFCPWHGKNKDKFKNIDLNGRRHFKWDRLSNLIDELVCLGVKAISLTGAGECLLYPHFPELIDKLVSSDIDFAITTNLSLPLKDTVIKNMLKAKWVRWSLNAGDNDTYIKVNRPNNRDSMSICIDNIKRMVALRNNGSAHIGVSYVIHPINIESVFKALDLCCELSVDSISFRPAITMKRSHKVNLYNKKITDILIKAEKEYSESIKVFTNLNRLQETYKVSDRNLRCYYSNYSIHIISSGAVYPCCMTRYDRRYEIANLSNISFIDLWSSDKRKNNYKKIVVSDCPPCRHTIVNEALNFMINTQQPDNFI